MAQFVYETKRKRVGFGKILAGTVATGLTAALLVTTYQAAQTETPGRSRAAPQTVTSVQEWSFDQETPEWVASGMTVAYEPGVVKLVRLSSAGVASITNQQILVAPSGVKYLQIRLSATATQPTGSKQRTFGEVDAQIKNLVVRYQIASEGGWQPPLLVRVRADGGMRLYEVRLPHSGEIELQNLQMDFSDLGSAGVVKLDSVKLLADPR